jgi:hypothetical protein
MVFPALPKFCKFNLRALVCARGQLWCRQILLRMFPIGYLADNMVKPLHVVAITSLSIARAHQGKYQILHCLDITSTL